ncbi:ribose 1,5-bisphosphokinase [Cognatiyoonia sediminum]|uniref:Ribose 1,5-bisphosphate phosphokinase PhnN n=1 Tax=Cognatiyoonia sediminum TaxID=1508389 RepID=A0A1M5NMQ7_9RHOB|nr:phosphonate metabolism protein/1,5-bisphosphokinase (PRPP-forming) PhnN [Cognatiyoonia sediminum]SHG90874.1 ribose 1,5-bisphosphokinase [Cognatiyoonia sediminum]
MTGRVIAVVGPSGVGKDSVMSGLKSLMPDLHVVRRVITREPGLGGEDYDAVSPEEFDTMVQSGAFALHWGGHSLRYGIPITVKYQLTKGTDCLVNFSRKALSEGASIFPNFLVLNITASPETLAKRLTARGRESEEEIAQRISVAQKCLPDGLDTVEVSNDGPLNQTVARAAALIQPVRA